MSNFPDYLKETHQQNTCSKHSFSWLGNVPCPVCFQVSRTLNVHYEYDEADFNKPYSQSGLEWRRNKDRGGL